MQTRREGGGLGRSVFEKKPASRFEIRGRLRDDRPEIRKPAFLRHEGASRFAAKAVAPEGRIVGREVGGVGDDEGEASPRGDCREPASASQDETTARPSGVFRREREGFVRAVRGPDLGLGKERGESEREGAGSGAEIKEARPGVRREEPLGEGDERFGFRPWDQDPGTDEEAERPEVLAPEKIGCGFAGQATVKKPPPTPHRRLGKRGRREKLPERVSLEPKRVREKKFAFKPWARDPRPRETTLALREERGAIARGGGRAAGGVC